MRQIDKSLVNKFNKINALRYNHGLRSNPFGLMYRWQPQI